MCGQPGFERSGGGDCSVVRSENVALQHDFGGVARRRRRCRVGGPGSSPGPQSEEAGLMDSREANERVERMMLHAMQVADGLIPEDSPPDFVAPDDLPENGLPWWFGPDYHPTPRPLPSSPIHPKPSTLKTTRASSTSRSDDERARQGHLGPHQSRPEREGPLRLWQDDPGALQRGVELWRKWKRAQDTSSDCFDLP